jgi:hypothetical protein
VRLQILVAVSKKITVFWIVAPYNLETFTDVSDVLTASIIRAMGKPRRATTQQDTHLHS